MKLLARLLAEAISRRIEAGSKVGAVLVALVLGALGFCLGYALHVAGHVDLAWVPIGIAIAMPLAIIGAIVGAAIGPAPKPVRLVSANSIRITNWNATLGPMILFLAGASVAGWMAVLTLSGNTSQVSGFASEPKTYLGMFAFIVLGVVVARSVWRVEIGDTITVRRFLGTRRFARKSIVDWGFTIRDEPPSRRPPIVPSTLTIMLPVRGTIQVRVSAVEAQYEAALLST